ncbi:MAG: adenosine kinase [Bacteroides sp.]|nr:adenosine kinase [Bacteroides sp.]
MQGRILGMGNALVDLIFQLPSDDLLEKWGLPKGSMTLIDQQQAGVILNHFGQTQPVLATGGSASNTITSIAALGGGCGFIGQIGKNDIYGDFYIEHLTKHGITPYFRRIDTPTGTAITLMSPDTERTFATYLGAAATMTEDNISRDIFSGYGYFHIEGYMVQNYALLEKSLHLAHGCGMVISLDLASYNIVKGNLDFLRRILPMVDVVFANEEEALAFTGKENLETLNLLAGQVAVAVVKIGSCGSLVMHKGKLYVIDADKVVKTDSNGAGDSYAAGFLYGMSRGLGVQECGDIASTVATQVVQVTGPKLTARQWEDLLPRIRKIEGRNTRWPE